MDKPRTHALQWHPAFYADIQIELEEEAGLLVFDLDNLQSDHMKASD